MTTYHFVAASETFLTVDEPLEEVLKERRRNYAETNRAGQPSASAVRSGCIYR